MEYYEAAKKFIDLSNLSFAGRILDIGGGGEGVISRHSGCRVVAIDKRSDELAETPDIGTKVVMDACNLQFLDGYFDTITCFYTLMYMDAEQIGRFLEEAYRVLKEGASLWIWDATIPSTPNADAFVAQVEVKIDDQQSISTGYGVGWKREHSLDVVEALCKQAGLSVLDSRRDDVSFSLLLTKTVVPF